MQEAFFFSLFVDRLCFGFFIWYTGNQTKRVKKTEFFFFAPQQGL